MIFSSLRATASSNRPRHSGQCHASILRLHIPEGTLSPSLEEGHLLAFQRVPGRPSTLRSLAQSPELWLLALRPRADDSLVLSCGIVPSPPQLALHSFPPKLALFSFLLQLALFPLPPNSPCFSFPPSSPCFHFPPSSPCFLFSRSLPLFRFPPSSPCFLFSSSPSICLSPGSHCYLFSTSTHCFYFPSSLHCLRFPPARRASASPLAHFMGV